MSSLQISTHIDSTTLTLPQLQVFVGQDVRITVETVEKIDPELKKRYPLWGLSGEYIDPTKPACAESDWDALK